MLKYLSTYSILLLAFNRFCALYFPYHYDDFFKGKTFFYWILGYDLTVVVLHSINFVYNLSYTWDFIQLILIFSLTVMLFVKIRKNIKQLSSFDLKEKNTINSMKRAAIVCLIDALTTLLYFIPMVYTDVFKNNISPIFENFIIHDSFSSNFLIYAYLVCASIFGPLYTISVIIDVAITFYVLRPYRNAILKFIGAVKNKFKKASSSVTTTLNANAVSVF